MTPAFLSHIEVAKFLGMSKNWLSANRAKLEREGFPRVDGLMGKTNSADVAAWVARRRQVPDAAAVGKHQADASAREKDYGRI